MKRVRLAVCALATVAALGMTALAQQRSAGPSPQGRPIALVGGTLIDGSTTPEVAVKRADVAVYRAKEQRNASVVEVPAPARSDPRFEARFEVGALVPVRVERVER